MVVCKKVLSHQLGLTAHFVRFRVWRCYAFSYVLCGFILFCGRMYQNAKIMR